jgi:protein-S-isoprenylcysteine O-methyltransferase Ste14
VALGGWYSNRCDDRVTEWRYVFGIVTVVMTKLLSGVMCCRGCVWRLLPSVVWPVPSRGGGGYPVQISGAWRSGRGPHYVCLTP